MLCERLWIEMRWTRIKESLPLTPNPYPVSLCAMGISKENHSNKSLLTSDFHFVRIWIWHELQGFSCVWRIFRSRTPTYDEMMFLLFWNLCEYKLIESSFSLTPMIQTRQTGSSDYKDHLQDELRHSASCTWTMIDCLVVEWLWHYKSIGIGGSNWSKTFITKAFHARRSRLIWACSF